MSAPLDASSRAWRPVAARWIRRGAAGLGSLALDAALDSLELGKRCIAWLSHAAEARTVAVVAVVALAVVIAGGATWALLAQLQSPSPTNAPSASAAPRSPST